MLYTWITVAATVATLLWEVLAPCRPGRAHELLARWLSNVAMSVVGSATVALVMRILGAMLVLAIAGRGVGLFDVLSLPGWLAWPLSFVLLDLGRYCFHRLCHAVPLLWRFHAVHHSDPEFDWSTSFRFHPVEAVLLNSLPHLGLVWLLGPPAAAVVGYEAVRGFLAVLGHANGRVPEAVNRAAVLLVVTPYMHRIHHSSRRAETDSNYGEVFPWWDRLFSTYLASPHSGHDGMKVGLEEYRRRRYLRLPGMLAQPFERASSGAAVRA